MIDNRAKGQFPENGVSETDRLKNLDLFFDLQVDIKLALTIERADRLHGTLLAIVLSPKLIVGILRKLAETVLPLTVGKIALHRQAASVLQVDHRTFDRRIVGIDYLTLHHPLCRSALLREQRRLPHSCKKPHHATRGQYHFAGKKQERDTSTLHSFSIRLPSSKAHRYSSSSSSVCIGSSSS